MELLEGETLDERLRAASAGFRRSTRCGSMRQIATLARARRTRSGIVHRDLKPDNIFIVGDPAVTGGERAKILDFGIAKLSATSRRRSRRRPAC